MDVEIGKVNGGTEKHFSCEFVTTKEIEKLEPSCGCMNVTQTKTSKGYIVAGKVKIKELSNDYKSSKHYNPEIGLQVSKSVFITFKDESVDIINIKYSVVK